MREGRSIVDLAAEVQRQAATKVDYVVNTRALDVLAEKVEGKHPDDAPTVRGRLVIAGADGGTFFDIKPNAHEQLAARLSVPRAYYDRLMAEQPGEWARHITERLHHASERRMVRTLDGAARAFLSDRYRRLDNLDLMEAILPPLVADTSLQVMSAEVTERRLYLKVVSQRIQAYVKKGEVVQAGVVISNSEIGGGAVSVQPLLFILACLNGAIVEDFRQHKYHVGRQVEEDGMLETMYRDETRRQDDVAFWMKVRDVVGGTLTEATFRVIVQRAREAADDAIEGDPAKSVEVLGDRLGLTEGERGSVLNSLIAGGDLSRWGVSNALTRASQNRVTVPAYDRATELERFGGKILTLAPDEWQAISQAA